MNDQSEPIKGKDNKIRGIKFIARIILAFVLFMVWAVVFGLLRIMSQSFAMRHAVDPSSPSPILIYILMGVSVPIAYWLYGALCRVLRIKNAKDR